MDIVRNRKKILSELSIPKKWQLRKEGLLGLFFPRRCPFCRRVIGFMPECDDAKCIQACNVEKLSVKRLDATEYYLKRLLGATAVYKHRGMPRGAILQIKFHQERSTGRQLGNIMAKELFGCELCSIYGITKPRRLPMQIGYHVIVPVPPSDATRGYNVPSLLAMSLHDALGVPVWEDALLRTRFIKRQATLSPSERFANVAGAFSPRQGLDLTGKDVLLVDDVITTGATVTACAQALRQAGANSVFAVSLTVGFKK